MILRKVFNFFKTNEMFGLTVAEKRNRHLIFLTSSRPKATMYSDWSKLFSIWKGFRRCIFLQGLWTRSSMGKKIKLVCFHLRYQYKRDLKPPHFQIFDILTLSSVFTGTRCWWRARCQNRSAEETEWPWHRTDQGHLLLQSEGREGQGVGYACVFRNYYNKMNG